MSTKNFKIILNLSNFYTDHRSLTRVFINENIQTIRNLKTKIKNIFKIKYFYLRTIENHFLPSAEDVRILNKDEVVWAVPHKENHEHHTVQQETVNTEKVKLGKRRVQQDHQSPDLSPSKRKKYEINIECNIESDQQTVKKKKKTPKTTTGSENIKKSDKIKTNSKKDSSSNSEKEQLKMTIQTHLKSYNETDMLQHSTSTSSSKSAEEFEKENPKCRGDLNNYRKYTPLPTVTNDYLAGKKINIIKIDVIKNDEVCIGPQSAMLNNSSTDKNSVADLSMELSPVGSGFVKSIVSDIEKKLTPESIRNVCKSGEQINTPNAVRTQNDSDSIVSNIQDVEMQPAFSNMVLPETPIVSRTISDSEKDTNQFDQSPFEGGIELKNNCANISSYSTVTEDSDTNNKQSINSQATRFSNNTEFLSCPSITSDSISLSDYESELKTDDSAPKLSSKDKPSISDSEVSFKIKRFPLYMRSLNKVHSGIGSLLQTLRTEAPISKSSDISIDLEQIPEVPTPSIPSEIQQCESMSVTSDSSNQQKSGNRRKRVRRRKPKAAVATIKDLNLSHLNGTPNSSPNFNSKPNLITPDKPSMHLRFHSDNELETETENDSSVVILSETDQMDQGELNIKKENLSLTEKKSSSPIGEKRNKIPDVSDVIVFKTLKMDENYTPQLSEQIIGKVVSVNDVDSLITCDILDGLDEFAEPNGRLSLPEENEPQHLSSIKEFRISDLIDITYLNL